MNLQEEKIEFKDIHEKIKIQELEIGGSIYFFWARTTSLTSEEYGSFDVMQGLQVDTSLTSEEEFLDKAIAASFIANTLISNLIKENSIVEGCLYRIEKTWNKGDKFAAGKKAKGYGYTFYKLGASSELLKKLSSRYKEIISPLDLEGGEVEVKVEKPNL